ncbi:RNB domain-containing ribonuclease [bacterium]|nr:RNB domain-containing ribonuclease [bacterium]
MSQFNLLQAGDVIEFIEQKKMLSSVCLSTRKSRAQILTENSRAMTLAPSRFIHITSGKLDSTISRKSLIEKLRIISANRHKISLEINLSDLWKIIDIKGQQIAISDLASQINNENPETSPDDLEAALIRTIFRTKCFFKINESSVYIFSEKEVAETEKLLQKQEQENQIIYDLAHWLDQHVNSRMISPPKHYQRLITALEAETVSLKEQPDKVWLKKVLGKMQSTPKQSSFQLLVKIGHFSPDENLHIIRSKYPRYFSNETIEELNYLINPLSATEKARIDLRNLDCYTVDGATTKDMDDALSFTVLSDGRFQIGIHITDVSAWIQPGSFLDEEARDRGQTLYLPDKTWHMFPEEFSEQTASLKEGLVLPALSTLITVSSSFEVEETNLVCSTIKIAERLTYDQVDQRIQEPNFKILLNFAKSLRRERINNGAIIMPRPEVSIDALDSHKLIFRKRLRQSNSQLIISELMILANKIAADKASESGLPFPYRTQQTPTDPIPRSDKEFNPYISYCQRRMMPRAENSLDPKSHFSLGLPVYTNVTSPLRRYFDVLAQRQLKAIMGYEEPYSRSELDHLMCELETSTSRSMTITHHRNRYWLLKYLSTFLGKSISAIILDRFSNRYQVWLEDLCIDADLPLSFGRKLLPEQQIMVIIEKVTPQNEILKLRLDG